MELGGGSSKGLPEARASSRRSSQDVHSLSLSIRSVSLFAPFPYLPERQPVFLLENAVWHIFRTASQLPPQRHIWTSSRLLEPLPSAPVRIALRSTLLPFRHPLPHAKSPNPRQVRESTMNRPRPNPSRDLSKSPNLSIARHSTPSGSPGYPRPEMNSSMAGLTRSGRSRRTLWVAPSMMTVRQLSRFFSR